jgi:hypothetical protein
LGLNTTTRFLLPKYGSLALLEDELVWRVIFFDVIYEMPPGKLAVLRSGVWDTPWYVREGACSQHESF